MAPAFASGQVIPKALTRITQPVNERVLSPLPGNTHSLAKARYDVGAVSDSLRAERLLLLLRRSDEQERALQSFLKSVQDPGSPDFRRFLTPEQFGQTYGTSDQDLETVKRWLQSHGLSISHVNKGRTAIEFSGTVGQIQDAFHVSIRKYQIGGVPHLANAADPMIPSALVPVVGGISRLNDFKPHPQFVKGPAAHWDAARHTFAPKLTITSKGSSFLFMGPGDAATVYNSPNAFNAKNSTQPALDGTGVTIGLVENTTPDFTDLINYRALFSLPSPVVTVIADGNPVSPDTPQDTTEALLDVEISQGLAPAANINFYTASDTAFQPGVFLAAYRAIDDNLVSLLSVSYGECEANLGSAGNLEILNAWEQAAAQGITVLVSSGDSGSAGCDDDKTESIAGDGLAVNGLASTAFDVAVGGTDFNVLDSNFAQYVGLTNAGNYTTALGYIPEDAWNDSAAKAGLLSNNTVYTDSAGHTNIVAGGGGASSAGDWSGAAPVGYAKPLWQAGYAPGNTDHVRDLPDVSLLAANGQNHALWAICTDNDCQGSDPTISGVGGTSAAAPALAGMLALVTQKLGSSVRLGQANWMLYKLAQSHPEAFHAIGASNIAVYCSTGTPSCGANNFLDGYNTAQGYSMATGLGSIDVTRLINAWASSALTDSTTTLSLDKTSFTHGTPVNVSVGVNPSAATGHVGVTNNASTQAGATRSAPGFNLMIANGSATGSFSQFPGGSYNVYANYGGDGTYSGSTSQPVAVTVSPEDSVLNFSVSAINASQQLVSLAGATVPLGTFTILRAVPIGKSQSGNSMPAANASGSVYFIDGATPLSASCSGNSILTSDGAAELDYATCPAGTHTISAQYNGDPSYNPSSAANVTFSVAQASTTVVLTSSATSISGPPIDLNVAVNPSWVGSYPYPNGTINLTDTTTNTVLGTALAEANACDNGMAVCVATPLSLYPSQLVLGANAIVATYSGDANFAASAPSAPVTINCITNCGNGTGQTLGVAIYAPVPGSVIDAGTTVTSTASISGNGGFSGAVNVSCAVTGTLTTDVNPPVCSASPAQVTVSSDQSGTITLTIKTTGPVKGGLKPSPLQNWYASGATLACVGLLGITVRRRRWQSYLMMVLFLSAVTGLFGCGGSSGGSGGGSSGGGSGSGGSGGGGTPGTTADIYTVSINAVDVATGTLKAQNYFKLTVE